MHALPAITALTAGAGLLGSSTAARDLVREVSERVWEVRELLSPSAWAEKYRILPPKVSDTPGLVDLDRTPYLRGFLDATAEPTIQRITCKKASQLGYTMALDTMLLEHVDQRPTPALWICPNAELAKEAAKFRIEPGARACPVTRDRLGESKEEATTKVLDFDLMRVSFVGSGNANNLRSRPAGLVIIDDFERCEAYTLREAEQRVAAFDESKIVIVSPPSFEGLGTDREYELSDKRFFAVACPHCGHKHELLWENLKWEGSLAADPDVVERTAWMECPHPKCKGRIENHHKPSMLRSGGWVAEAPHVTSHAGFRMNSLYSPWRKFGWVARGFLDSKGKPDRTWRNGVLGLAEKTPGAIELKDLKELAKGAPTVPGLEGWVRRTVPNDACTLIATVDIQSEYVYVLVTAWGPYGLRAYYVDHFVRPLPHNAPLEAIYHEVKSRRYQRQDGRWMRLVMQAWDTGHRTPDTYAAWRRFAADKKNPFMLVKGHGSLTMNRAWYYTKPEENAPTEKGRALGLSGGAVQVLILNTRQWKDRVAFALRAALAGVRSIERKKNFTAESAEGAEQDGKSGDGIGETGASIAEAAGAGADVVGIVLGKTAAAGEGVMTAYFLPPDVPADFLEHLSSEQVREGRWMEIREHVRNEGWDCSYYAAAAGDAAGLRSSGPEWREKFMVGAPSQEQMRAWGLGETVGGGKAAKKAAERQSGRAADRQTPSQPPPPPTMAKGEERRQGTRTAVARKPSLEELRRRLAGRMRR